MTQVAAAWACEKAGEFDRMRGALRRDEEGQRQVHNAVEVRLDEKRSVNALGMVGALNRVGEFSAVDGLLVLDGCFEMTEMTEMTLDEGACGRSGEGGGGGQDDAVTTAGRERGFDEDALSAGPECLGDGHDFIERRCGVPHFAGVAEEVTAVRVVVKERPQPGGRRELREGPGLVE